MKSEGHDLGSFLPGSVERFGFANGTRLRLGTPKSFNNLLGSVTVLSIASNDGPKAVKVRLNMICGFHLCCLFETYIETCCF